VRDPSKRWDTNCAFFISHGIINYGEIIRRSFGEGG
jgi:hypothetical protein